MTHSPATAAAVGGEHPQARPGQGLRGAEGTGPVNCPRCIRQMVISLQIRRHPRPSADADGVAAEGSAVVCDRCTQAADSLLQKEFHLYRAKRGTTASSSVVPRPAPDTSSAKEPHP